MAPQIAGACACGCGIFEVGTASMLPEGPGGMVFVEYDYQNQYINWSGNSRAPVANNGDKRIDTDFITTGLQYFWNRSWGIQVEVPYDNRTFRTETADPNTAPGAVASVNWGELGDIRVKGIYTGLSEDLSTGLEFGVKLPTGNYNENDAFGDVDRDSELGTCSTDILLGAFHRQHFTEKSPFTWFTQVELDLPVLIQQGYRPGFELDGSVGVYYSGFALGPVKITPIAQVLGSWRGHDSGDYASGGVDDPPEGIINSGYERLLLSPGLELDFHPITVYADVEIPVFQHETGNQLTAPFLFKLVASYHF